MCYAIPPNLVILASVYIHVYVLYVCYACEYIYLYVCMCVMHVCVYIFLSGATVEYAKTTAPVPQSPSAVHRGTQYSFRPTAWKHLGLADLIHNDTWPC